jgi:hypothetical protein
MSLTLYTTKGLEMPPLNCSPNIVEITKDNIELLIPHNITILPALIKTIGKKTLVYQGIKDIEHVTDPSLAEIADSLREGKEV